MKSRAVLRQVEPGQAEPCAHCERLVTWQARKRPKRVVANRYENSVWREVLIYHPACYADAGEPFGEAV